MQPVATTPTFSAWSAAKAATAGALSSAITSVGAGIVTALNSPKAVATAYKNLWSKDNAHVGFDLKGYLSVTGVPAAAALAQPTSWLAGANFGLFRGYSEVMGNNGGVISAAKQSISDVKAFAKAAKSYDDAITPYLTGDLEGTESNPADITLPGIVTTSLAAGLSSAALSLVAGGLALYRTPEVVGKLLKGVWTTDNANTAQKLAATSAILMATPLALASAPWAGLVFGYGTALKTGYTEGFKAAMDNTSRYIDAIYDASKIAVTGNFGDAVAALNKANGAVASLEAIVG